MCVDSAGFVNFGQGGGRSGGHIVTFSGDGSQGVLYVLKVLRRGGGRRVVGGGGGGGGGGSGGGSGGVVEHGERDRLGGVCVGKTTAVVYQHSIGCDVYLPRPCACD